MIEPGSTPWLEWWQEVRMFMSITVVGLIAEYARRKMPPPKKDEDT